jgi:hypothetical protein
MDMDTEFQNNDDEDSDEEVIDLEELLAELDQLSRPTTNARAMYEARKKATNVKDAKTGKNPMQAKKAKDAEVTKKAKDLNEALRTVRTLRSELSEVNLLNAKLLYLNRVFRASNLTESQKATVITSFDKAVTVKEVKLVYETVKESFVNNKSKSVIKESKGFASAAAGHSTKPSVIDRVDEQVLRMQKLAGIIR